MRSIRTALLLVLGLAALGCGPVLLPEDARVRETIGLQHTLLWSRGDVGLVDELFTEDVVAVFPGPTVVEGREALKAFVQDHRAAFPDWTESVESIVIEGDRAASRWTSTGTHEGRFMGIPATGRRVEIDEAAFYRLRDGRIAEYHAFPDTMALRAQLTAPEAGAAPDEDPS
jgi:steroid delta-isomerase-like uncharacterized protein